MLCIVHPHVFLCKSTLLQSCSCIFSYLFVFELLTPLFLKTPAPSYYDLLILLLLLNLITLALCICLATPSSSILFIWHNDLFIKPLQCTSFIPVTHFSIRLAFIRSSYIVRFTLLKNKTIHWQIKPTALFWKKFILPYSSNIYWHILCLTFFYTANCQ